MSILKLLLALFFSTAWIQRAAAGEIVNIPEIGPHQPVLIVEKNVNPQNIMVFYTKVDAKGRLVIEPANGNRPVFDFYWLMEGKKYKPVHARIKNEIGKRLEHRVSSSDPTTHFTVDVNDLKEVDSDIADPKMDVYARVTGGGPEVDAQMNLGPSNGNMRIRLSSIYTEGRAFPPAVFSVTLKGQEIVDGKPTGRRVTRRFEAKK